MKKALFVVGPTASGKTDLALSLSSAINAALISADSVQVYKTLDIISGKDIPPSFTFHALSDNSVNSHFDIGYYTDSKTPLFLIDIASPTYNFSVSDYSKNVAQILPFIRTLKKTPLIVGGTGYYITALLEGIDTMVVPPNDALRHELSMLSLEALQQMLSQENFERFAAMNESDKKNKRRLTRAIEVTRFGPVQDSQKRSLFEDFDIKIIGLKAPRELLNLRIDVRVEKRLEKGALEEAKELFQHYDTLSANVKTSNGYEQLFCYYRGETSFEEAIQKWKLAEYHHAKRQMTWFGKDKRIEWFDISEDRFEERVKQSVREWYEES